MTPLKSIFTWLFVSCFFLSLNAQSSAESSCEVTFKHDPFDQNDLYQFKSDIEAAFQKSSAFMSIIIGEEYSAPNCLLSKYRFARLVRTYFYEFVKINGGQGSVIINEEAMLDNGIISISHVLKMSNSILTDEQRNSFENGLGASEKKLANLKNDLVRFRDERNELINNAKILNEELKSFGKVEKANIDDAYQVLDDLNYVIKSLKENDYLKKNNYDLLVDLESDKRFVLGQLRLYEENTKNAPELSKKEESKAKNKMAKEGINATLDIEFHYTGKRNEDVVYDISYGQPEDAEDVVLRTPFPVNRYKTTISQKLINLIINDVLLPFLNERNIDSKSISVKILGTADGLPINGEIEYKGEAGRIFNESKYNVKEDKTEKMSIRSAIRNNNELAFVRAFVVKERLHELLGIPREKIEVQTFVYPEKGYKYRKIEIELYIKDARKAEGEELMNDLKILLAQP